MSDVINAHDLGVAGGYIIEAAMQGDIDQLKAENAKLRELVRDMWRDGMCECDERGACAQCEYHFLDRMRELGVEASDE